MGLFGFISGITASEKALGIADKATTGLISGVDKLFYTDEEKADSAIQRAQIAKELSATHLKLMEATASENTARSITRRALAIMIMGVFLLLLIASASLWKVFPGGSAHILSVAMVLNNLALGVGFFFHILRYYVFFINF